MFFQKTIIATSIGLGLASGLFALPVRAKVNDSVKSADAELILSQIVDGEPSNNFQNDNFKNIVGLTGLAIGTGVVGYHVRKAYKPSLANSLSGANNNSRASLLARVSPKLRRELLRLVHDRHTANRLMNGTFNSHPHRSANWVAEKVIYDLKRGR